MKTIFTLFISIFCITLNAQNLKTLDTIYANNSKTVSLFFPKPIRQGIVGKSNFVFSYNKDKEQFFGLLQGAPGVESNLLAITNDGQVYSYILKYADKLSKLNYFIAKKESIGNENPISKTVEFQGEVIPKTESGVEDKLGQYKKNSTSLIKHSKRNLNCSKRGNKMKVSVKDIIYDNNALYFLLEIRNNSTIDYDINFLRFFTTNDESIRKKSSQTLLIKPIFKYQVPKRIKGNSKSEFVVVFPKFTIDNHKKIMVELNELFGERNLRLKISGRLINNIN